MACAPWLPPKTSSVGVPPRLGDLEKRLPHRNSRDFGVTKIFRGLFEMDRRAGNEFRHHAIRKSRHNVRLKCQRRNVLHHRRQHGRARGISAHADHHVGSELVQHAARVPNRARQIECRFQARHQADIFQRSHAHQLQWISRGRNQTILDPARRSDEQHFGVVTLLQLIGDGQRGNHMSARASARQNRPHVVTINYDSDGAPRNRPLMIFRCD